MIWYDQSEYDNGAKWPGIWLSYNTRSFLSGIWLFITFMPFICLKKKNFNNNKTTLSLTEKTYKHNDF